MSAKSLLFSRRVACAWLGSSPSPGGRHAGAAGRPVPGSVGADGRDHRFGPCCNGRAVVECPAWRKEQGLRMSPYIALVCFPVIFVGELPDKTMLASLVMATRARPVQVWAGAAMAFAAHVAIAVTAGVALFALLPRQAVNAVVAAAFVAGAVYAWASSRSEQEETVGRLPSGRSVVLSAFMVIFVAEWGDLTQILTANLAAKYGSPLSVAIGSVAALWAVAAIAVMSGSTLPRFVSIRRTRQVTAVVLNRLGHLRRLDGGTLTAMPPAPPMAVPQWP